MHPVIHAILTAIVCFAVPAAQAGSPATGDTAQRIRFRLADGVRLSGEMTDWDRDGLTGSFGRRQWTQLKAADTWKVYRQVMDEDSVTDWVNLGRIMLLVEHAQPAAARYAERAFERARRMDGDGEHLIDIARQEAAEAQRLREAKEREETAQAASPEAEAWRADAWPLLSAEEQIAATTEMRAETHRLLADNGVAIEPVETDYFLFYSDMPRTETAKWALELDNMYKRLARVFDLPPGQNIFWGKAVILVFMNRETFEQVEANAFRYQVPPWASGLCHPRGPKVFVSFFRQPDDHRFAAILVHETVHGFMHRYRTPYRLPTWANEGFAEYLAAVTFRGSPVDTDRRQQGVLYVRDGGNVNAILDMTYRDGWPGGQNIGYAVGYLMVELMIRDRPQRFGAWVNAIKGGKEWEQALVDEFGVSRLKLVRRFVQFYMVND